MIAIVLLQVVICIHDIILELFQQPPVTPSDSSKETDTRCPPELALAAIESSFSAETLQRYRSTMIAGSDIHGDPHYSTWKHYVEKVDAIDV